MPSNLDAPLVAREPLDPPYFLLTFRHPAVAREARAGQFVMIKASAAAEPLLRRPFSIMTVDAEGGTFTLFVKAVGPGSRALVELQPGQTAACLGALGRGFTPPAPGEEALLVAGGYGIAPFHLFCEQLARQGGRGRVFYGGRNVADLQLRDRFAALGAPLATTTNDGSHGRQGLVTEALDDYLDAQPRPAGLYACGPDAMLHAVARLAQRRGLTAQVSLDPWMGCGLGTCLGCVVRVQRAGEARPRWRCACTEGPVFSSREVVWAGESASAAASQDAQQVRA